MTTQEMLLFLTLFAAQAIQAYCIFSLSRQIAATHAHFSKLFRGQS